MSRLRLHPLTHRLRGLLAAAIPAFALLLLGASGASASGGALDTTFGSGGFGTAPLGGSTWVGAAAAKVQSDGKVVTAGEAQVGGKYEIVSTRFLSNGTLDPTYGNGGWVIVDVAGSSGANALAIQSDGKIVLAGTGVGSNYALDFAAVRLNPNGSLDQSFGRGGIATVPIGSYAIANAVVLEPNGQIALGGMATVGGNVFAVARLNANGSLDTSFGTNGSTTFNQPGAGWGMVLQTDGKLVLQGQDGSNKAYMAARVLANGRPDTGFGQGGIVTVPIGSWAFGDAIALQSDGKLILAGSAYTNRGTAATVRLNPNGSLDPSFGAGGISTVTLWQGVNAVTLDGSGRVVIAAVGAAVVRLNTNGTADTTFGTGGVATATIGTNTAANGVTIEPGDGKIIISGVATIGGVTKLFVARLTGSGSTTPNTTTPPKTGVELQPTRTLAAVGRTGTHTKSIRRGRNQSLGRAASVRRRRARTVSRTHHRRH
jgi:uncharacterized delta-60 repeat protein